MNQQISNDVSELQQQLMPSTDLESIKEMAVSATWMDLEVIILSSKSERK